MRKLKIYLSGNVKNADKSFQDWRNICTHYWHSTGVYLQLEFVNPIDYFNYTDKLSKTDKQCLDLFMHQIDHCDVLLLNLDYSQNSIGAAMEVEHAFCKGVPIIAFGKKPDTWYNWIVERASVVFDTVDDAVDYIQYVYGYLCV